MTSTKTLLLAAALTVPGIVAATQAQAQVSGIAVADPEAAVANSRAWTAARGQIQTTYKTQLDQAEARRRAITAELQPLATAYQNAARQPGASEASLRPQAQALQTREAAANQELARLTEPAQRAQAYALEQISRRVNEAVQAAVRARNVTLLLRPAAALFAQPTADITPAITTELDRLVPSVTITPPPGWQPGQQGAAAAPAAGARPAVPAPAAPARRPQGR
jgi:Skp family chaperone for outer membrane proteins